MSETVPSVPVIAFWERFKAPLVPDEDPHTASGDGFGWGDPVWWGRRLGNGQRGAALHLDVPQTVLTAYGQQREVAKVDRYTHYGIQIACWHPNLQVATLRCKAVADRYAPLVDHTQGDPGVSFPGWHAQHIRVDCLEVVDSIELTGGDFLYKAVTDLHFVNLAPVLPATLP